MTYIEKFKIERKRKINYYLGNDDKKKISVFKVDVDLDELYKLIINIPNIIKEQTFDIIRIKKNLENEKEIYPDLHSVLKNIAISSNNFSIMDFSFNNDDISDLNFFTSDMLSTDAYDVYVKWKEKSELAIYLSEFLIDDRAAGTSNTIDLNLATIVKNIYSLNLNSFEQQKLYEEIINCFSFSFVDEIAYDTINIINMSSCYELFSLSSKNSLLQKIFVTGKNNLIAVNHNFIENEIEKFKVNDITTSSGVNIIEQEMLKSNDSFSSVAAFYQDRQEIVKADEYVKFSILDDDGTLYRYRGIIDYISLYQLKNEINTKYNIKKQKKFDIIPWDCYKKIPILDGLLNSSDIKNLNFDLSECKIDVRNRVATDIIIEWEKTPKLSVVIDKFISNFIKKPEIDLSLFTETIDEMDISSDEKKQIKNKLLYCFHLTLFEVIPHTIISEIKSIDSSTFLDLNNAKSRLEKSLDFGRKNKDVSFLEENKEKIKTLIFKQN